MRVLIVDDMPAFRRIVRYHFKALGVVSIDEAVDGDDAWERIHFAAGAGEPFDLVLCDMKMPGMAGMDLLRLIRENDTVSNTCFVLMTADSELGMISDALNLGVNDYIVKPFTGDQLKSKLAVILAADKRDVAIFS